MQQVVNTWCVFWHSGAAMQCVQANQFATGTYTGRSVSGVMSTVYGVNLRYLLPGVLSRLCMSAIVGREALYVLARWQSVKHRAATACNAPLQKLNIFRRSKPKCPTDDTYKLGQKSTIDENSMLGVWALNIVSQTKKTVQYLGVWETINIFH